MANPTLITTPFAASGDRSVPPLTDPNGFVNFTAGYTPDYEINLASGDPQAKAVERGVQNYLFGVLTESVAFWQAESRPSWYNNMPGGYAKGAEVVFPAAGGLPYRSLVNGNVATPGSSVNWEYIQTSGEMLQNIPMPSGGPTGPGTYLITTTTDFNNLNKNGSYQFATDAVASGSGNAPSNGGTVGGAGMLEVTTWTLAGNTYISQFYRDRNGIGFLRGATNGNWTIWKIWANATQFVVGEVRMWSGTGTQQAVTAAWGPGWHLCDGTLGTPNLADRFIIGSSGSRAPGTSGGSFNFTLSVANLPPHGHPVSISDPGHAHGVYDPGHNHGLHDPGHAHGVYDPGHAHAHPPGGWCQSGQDNGGSAALSPPNQYGANGNVQNTYGSGTGIGIYGSGTGIYMDAAGTGVSIYNAASNISASAGNTGSGQAVTVTPPYYSLCMVMFTGA